MKHFWVILSTGFALFSMFFGSGNLVFPITVGKECEGFYLLSTLGILLTGVLVPFLGMFAMVLYNGSISDFFNFLGRRGIFWFSLISLSLMGPFGVLARCLTVIHGALLLIFKEANLSLTSFVTCLLIYLLTINKHRIVSILGSALTPFLLASIGVIAYFGLSQSNFSPVEGSDPWKSFMNGFHKGYQTMDLLASFFFSTFTIHHLQRVFSKDEHPHAHLRVFLKSAMIGGSLLSFVYFLLVMLGFRYAPLLTELKPQEMLGKIALEAIGPSAAPIICLAVILACMTTAITLTSLYAEFIRKNISSGKMGNKSSLFITLSIGFLVSTLDFTTIAKILAPILETVYPALIGIVIVNIVNKLYNMQIPQWPSTLILLANFYFF